jgi:outer membrane immunogenic protein
VIDSSYDWSGIYAGGVVGYGWAESQHCDGIDCDFSGPDVDSDGFMGGATLGYNHQLEQLVLGIEADYMFADVDGSTPPGSINGYGCGSGCETDINGLGTVRARLGFAVDRFMPFISGGVAIMDVEAALNTGSSDTFINPVAGLGVEFAFSDSVTIKAEYLHVFDNGEHFVFNNLCGAPGCGVKDVSLDVVRMGVNFQF